MIKEAEDSLRRGSESLALLERQNLKHPEILTSAQQAVECFARALYALLELDFRFSHEALLAVSKEEGKALLQEELQTIAEVEVPALFPYADWMPKIAFLAFSWSSYREQVEAASQHLGKPVSAFFGREEARAALEQARLCHKAAKSLLELKR